ncbi:MAG: alpha/beta hydrolase [Idiomarina sp.]|nr:MAG: alpha/beta hydrolase [Idiomarina sp.]
MALVLIPGFMLSDDLWSDLLPNLRKFGPVYHADPKVGDSINSYALNLLKQAPNEFSLIAFSMGGYVAREIVRLAPKRVKKLILIATSNKGDTAAEALKKKNMVGDAIENFGGLSKQSIRNSLSPENASNQALIERVQRMGVDLGANVFIKQSSFVRVSDTPLLKSIDCPTLIVAGQHDRIRSKEEAEKLHVNIPNSKIVFLNTGHLIPLEAPADLGRVISEFINSSF